MGFRFYKSFKIAKGLKLNISKSGPSLTIGKRGLTFNLSKRGTYMTASLPKTGLSYRTKIGGKKKSSTNTNQTLTEQYSSSKKYSKIPEYEENKQLVEDYLENENFIVNMHNYSPDVVTQEDFVNHLSELDNEEMANSLGSLISGDQEVLTEVLDNFFSDTQMPYEMNVSYNLSDDSLYLDVDLPEVEDFPNKYPTLMMTGEILDKVKNVTTVRSQYANSVIALSIFLAANIFNITPYIKQIIVSGYTQKRDSVGDIKDVYLYSVIYTRELFEEANFEELGKPYDFMLKFRNRINLSTTSTFKEIVPFPNFQ